MLFFTAEKHEQYQIWALMTLRGDITRRLNQIVNIIILLP